MYVAFKTPISESIETCNVFNTLYFRIWCCLQYQWQLFGIFYTCASAIAYGQYFSKNNALNLHVPSALVCLMAWIDVITLPLSLALNNWHKHQRLSQSIFLSPLNLFGQDIREIVIRPCMCQLDETRGKITPHIVICNRIVLLFQGSWQKGTYQNHRHIISKHKGRTKHKDSYNPQLVTFLHDHIYGEVRSNQLKYIGRGVHSVLTLELPLNWFGIHIQKLSSNWETCNQV